MTPERWQQIETLYHAALERPPQARSAFLAGACAHDASLRVEVERLLRAEGASWSFIEGNVMEQEARHLVLSGTQQSGPQLLAGQAIGVYKIQALLGRGGMGVVYRARDERLSRDVAIKVLPAGMLHDQARLKRFEQEARATTALNHPNILTVYDIGQHNGEPYIVAELLEGEELRAQLAHGALPIKRAIDYAQQIAAGLAAAHAKGIVHRDLKPENLFVTNEGRVKILDFGLAKIEPPQNVFADSADAALNPLTTPGTVLGTVAYMSPEQVRGEVVDQRSDIFSFGQVLYEMLVGQRAFNEATIPDLMSAILKEELPDLSASNPQINPQLEKIVRRCLEKKPERRFQTASDLGFALEALSSAAYAIVQPASIDNAVAPTAGSPPAYRGNRERLWRLLATALAVGLLALGAAYFWRPANHLRTFRLSFTPPENLSFDNAQYDYAIVSPDGQKLIFTGRSADGKRQLYVRPFDSSEVQLLPGTEDALSPFWSPDSRTIGFGAQGKLKRVEIAGGRPQTLCDAGRLEGGTWNREGVIVFAPTIRSGLFRVLATGGEPQPVTNLDAARDDGDHQHPYFLPDGRHFLFTIVKANRTASVFVGALDSKEVKPLLSDTAPAIYAAPGWLLFPRDGGLMAQSFKATNLELSGDPIPLTPPTGNAPILTFLGSPFSVSENGVVVWQGARESAYQLVWYDRTGKLLDTLGPPVKQRLGEAPRLSPDGKQVALSRTDKPTQNDDIWLVDLARKTPTRLTTNPATDQQPIWSPEGKQIIFVTQREGKAVLFQKAVNDSAEDKSIGTSSNGPTDWSANGQFVFFIRRTEKTRRDVWVLSLFGDRQPSPLLNSEFDEYRAQLSPNGRWLAYVSDESGTFEIYVQPFTVDGKLTGNKVRVSTAGGNQPRFSRNGRELFYVAGDEQMMAVTYKSGGTTFEFEPPVALFKTQMLRGRQQSGTEYDVTADGQRFLIGSHVGQPAPVSIILNWTAGLKP